MSLRWTCLSAILTCILGASNQNPALWALNTMKLPRLPLGVSPRHGLLAILAALLGTAAFPPLGLWPLSLASIVFLLCLLRNRTTREALDLSLVYGVVYGLGTMWWFFGIFGALA